MTIDLAADVEKFLREQLQAAVSTNANDLVNDILRSVRELEQKSFQVTPELESWLLQAADSLVTPLTPADFDGIRERARTGRSTVAS